MSHTIFHDAAHELGEGPTYDPDSGTAWWFDITGRHLIERPDAGDAIVHELPLMASALAVIDADRQLLACEDGLHVREVATGALSRMLPLEADNPTTRANDSRVHPSGAFWIGTMGKRAEPGAGSIYHYRRGAITKLYANITVPNAICFSADGSVGYFTDTPTGQVMRVALDPATGIPAAEPTVFIDRPAGVAGHPDGAVIDAEGLLWNARWDGSCLTAFDASGTAVETIELPTSQITCPAFIGDNRMIVTSAARGLDPDTAAAEPHAGKTFLLNRTFNPRYDPKVAL